MDFGFMNVILLHNDYQHVSATHVVIFRAANAIIQTCYGVSGSLHSSNHIVLVTGYAGLMYSICSHHCT